MSFIDTLLVAGADVNIQGGDGRTALMIAADRGDNVVLNKLLDCSKLDLNAKDKDGKTAYDLARMKGHTVVCSRLGLSGSVKRKDVMEGERK